MVDIEINMKCPKCNNDVSNDGEDIIGDVLYVKGYCYSCKSYYDLEYKLNFTLIKFEQDLS